MAMSAEYIGLNLQPFTGNGNIYQYILKKGRQKATNTSDLYMYNIRVYSSTKVLNTCLYYIVWTLWTLILSAIFGDLSSSDEEEEKDINIMDSGEDDMSRLSFSQQHMSFDSMDSSHVEAQDVNTDAENGWSELKMPFDKVVRFFFYRLYMLGFYADFFSCNIHLCRLDVNLAWT